MSKQLQTNTCNTKPGVRQGRSQRARAALPVALLLAACGGSDAAGEDPVGGNLAPSGRSSPSSEPYTPEPGDCGDGIEVVQPVNTGEEEVRHTELVGGAIFYATDTNTFRLPIGADPSAAQAIGDNTYFIRIGDRIGMFARRQADQPGAVTLYAPDGTPGETVSLPVTAKVPEWIYEEATNSLLGVKTTLPFSLVRVDLASGQTREIAVTPDFLRLNNEGMALTSAGLIVESNEKVYRVDLETGNATEIETGFPEFSLRNADDSNAYLLIRDVSPNALYRLPLEGGTPTHLSELDDVYLYMSVFVTPVGTFGTTSELGGIYPVYRIGPDTAAPTQVAAPDCHYVESMQLYEGLLYMTTTPYDDDVTWLSRMPLP